MSRTSDLVLDTKLQTEFHDRVTTHLHPEINEQGRRFYQKEEWKGDQILGHGGFGQVQLQKCITKGTKGGTLRAVKILHKPSSHAQCLVVDRELEAIAKFSNNRYKRWFVKSFGWYENQESIFITMEYCHHGDLYHYIQQHPQMPVMAVQELAFQMVEGLEQMHSNGFAHRDLKPANILIKAIPAKEGKWWIVLSDFGISKRADESNGPSTTIKGTQAYMAPELLGYLEDVTPNTISDFQAADMWAIGELIFQMITGQNTFSTPIEILKYCNGQRQFPTDRLAQLVTDECCDFVTCVMKVLPKDRKTANQCVEHRWLSFQRLEAELSTLHLGQSQSLKSDFPSHVSASARWSNLPDTRHELLVPITQVNAPVGRDGTDSLNHKQLKAMRRDWRDQPEELETIKRLDPSVMKASSYSLDYTQLEASQSNSKYQPEDLQTITRVTPLVEKFSSYNSQQSQPVDDHKENRDQTVGLKRAKFHDSSIISLTPAKVLKGHYNVIKRIIFSPDGQHLASTSTNEVRIWNIHSGEMIQRLKHQIRADLAYTSDGRHLATLSNQNGGHQILTWDVVSWAVVATYEAYDFHPRCICFSPDDQQLAAIGLCYRVYVWNTRSGKVVQHHSSNAENSFYLNLTFSPDGKWLVAGSDRDLIKFWHAETGRATTPLRSSHDREFQFFFFSPDSTLFLVGLNHKEVRIWDTRSWEIVHAISCSDFAGFTPDGKLLAYASGTNNCMITFLDVKSWKIVQTVAGDGSSIICFDFHFSSGSKHLATIGSNSDDNVQLWDVKVENPGITDDD